LPAAGSQVFRLPAIKIKKHEGFLISARCIIKRFI
jgi:hypothetical protein